MPDFPKLLALYQDAPEFVQLASEKTLTPDSGLYTLETTHGTAYVYYEDYLSGMEFLRNTLEKVVPEPFTFAEVIEPLAFEQAGPVRAAVAYTKPTDWEEIARYATDQYGPKPYYFSFLLLPTPVVLP